MKNNNAFVSWFRNAAPYIHAHRGKTFIVQISGDVSASKTFPHLMHDLALLNSLAIKLIIVFGARPQIDALLKERNITPRYNGALRITDEATIHSVKHAVGEIKIQIEALLSMGLPNSPMAASAIKVASGNYVTGRPYGVVNGVDMDLTGGIRKSDKKVINARLDAGEIVLIPPLGYSITGEVFNLSAIEVATQVAIDLSADKLIMLNATPFLKSTDGQIIRQITCTRAKEKLATDFVNTLDKTSKTALAQGIKACESGVKRIHFIDQNIDGGILQELFSRDGIGTLLSGIPFDTIQKATVNHIGGILELIKPLEEQSVLVKRSREKIEVDINDYIVLVRDGMVIACAALHHYPADHIMELACMAVHADYQNQSKGDMLYQFIESSALENGATMLFLLTTQTAHWFLERGFTETTLNSIPIQKQDIYNLQRQSKVFIKRL